jgi:transcriptional regulator
MEVSAALISEVTGSVLDEVRAWQDQPLAAENCFGRTSIPPTYYRGLIEAFRLTLPPPCCFPKRTMASYLLETKKTNRMRGKTDVRQGTLALMVLKTLDVLGSLHGYGIARRIEQISGDLLTVNQGTLYPVLLKLEQDGAIASEWDASENNRKARFYRLTRAGRKQLLAETRDWEQTAAIIGRFFTTKAEDLG